MEIGGGWRERGRGRDAEREREKERESERIERERDSERNMKRKRDRSESVNVTCMESIRQREGERGRGRGRGRRGVVASALGTGPPLHISYPPALDPPHLSMVGSGWSCSPRVTRNRQQLDERSRSSRPARPAGGTTSRWLATLWQTRRLPLRRRWLPVAGQRRCLCRREAARVAQNRRPCQDLAYGLRQRICLDGWCHIQ
jgi:hypothetical protein